MFPKDVYINRRNRLREIMNSGLVLILGNPDSPMNAPANIYHFRQDSSFLYFFGLDHPNFAGVLDVDNNIDYIYGDDVDIDDIIWMGPQPSVKDRAAKVGIENSSPFAKLKGLLDEAVKQGRKIHFLPAYRAENKILLEELLGVRSVRANDYVSEELIKAVVDLRSVKDEYEIKELERAAVVGYNMHVTAMKMARDGVYEREVAGEIEAITLRAGGMISFPSIVSKRGETLHNHYHGNQLHDGDLLLVDAGAETDTHYASDNTRTIPVGGKFTKKQREIYDIVVACVDKGHELTRPGVTYKSVHMEVCKVLASGLKNLGLMKGDVDEAVKAGAHALFMPHGLGHMMGLDVHDMEDIGETYVGYDDQVQRSDQFGTMNLRLGRELQPGFVLTNEPGCYFIPALIDQWQREGLHTQFIDYDKVNEYRDFGGIRLEDDVLVTENGSRIIGKRIPIYADDVEALMAE